MEKTLNGRRLSWMCSMLPDVRRGFWLDAQLDTLTCWPEQVQVAEDVKEIARLAHRQQALTQSQLLLAGQAYTVMAQPLRADLGVLVFVLESGAKPASFQRLLAWACEWLEQLLQSTDTQAGAPDLLFDYLNDAQHQTQHPASAFKSLPLVQGAETTAPGPLRALERAALFAQRHWGFDCHLVTRSQGRALSEPAPASLSAAERDTVLACAPEPGELADYQGMLAGRRRSGVILAAGRGEGRTLVLFCRSARADETAPALTAPQRKQLQLLALLTRQNEAVVRRSAPMAWWRKTRYRIALAALLLVAIGALPLEYRLSTGVTLEGAEQHAVVAPFDGFVGEVHFRAGDQVEKGTTIMAMDTRDLLLAAQKLEAEIDEFQQQYRRDLAGRELASAMVWRERLQQSRIQLQRVQQQLQRALITAPFAGHLISGNLNYKLNAPVSQGEVLYEIASLQGYRLLLEVAESDIRFLAPGQRGTLQLRSMPQQALDMRVTRILPVPLRESGAQSYLAEAVLDGEVAGLQPGMEGIAKVGVGKHALAWISFHHLIDWLSLQWWLWTP